MVCPHRLVVQDISLSRRQRGFDFPWGQGTTKGRLSISLEFFLLGSMPERLMGTDCKFVGNMSTLVQIQLGPKIRRSTRKWYHITHFGLSRNARSPNTEEKFSSLVYLYHYLFTLFFQQIRILKMIQIHIRICKYKVKSKEKGK